MDEERAMKLSRYRVGEDQPMGKDMTDEEIAMRRQFIKTMFSRVAPWKDLVDEQINNVRIYKVGSEWLYRTKTFTSIHFKED